MAYFEIDVLGGGNTRIDSATLLDSDRYMIPVSGTLDMLVWNASETPVDVYLLVGHPNLVFVKDPDHYEDIQAARHVRSIVTDNSLPLGGRIDIDGLAPGEYFPFRVANPSGSATRPWLDANSCVMNTSGHGTNIFNGQRVYVIGHHA